MNKDLLDKWNRSEESLNFWFDSVNDELSPKGWFVELDGYDGRVSLDKFMYGANLARRDGRGASLIPDFFNILNGLPVKFDEIKSKFKIVFESMLISRDEMFNKFKELEDEIDSLKKSNKKLKSDLDEKNSYIKRFEFGYEELLSIISIKVDSVLDSMDSINEGDRDKIVKAEIENARKFINIKKKQIYETVKKIEKLEKKVDEKVEEKEKSPLDLPEDEDDDVYS